MPVQFVPEYYSNNSFSKSLDKSIDNMGKIMAQQAEQRHQQNMLLQSYAQQAALQQQEANHQREQLELAYKLEVDRQLKIEKQRLKTEQQKMIITQREYEYKVKVLSYSVLGLSVLATLLVFVVIFKRRQSQKV